MMYDDEWIVVFYVNCEYVVGLFYYGMWVDFFVGDLLMVGFIFNYDEWVVMNYVYFIVMVKGVGLVVEMVCGVG